MSRKLFVGGVFAVCVLGMGAVGAVTVQRQAAPKLQESSLPPHAREFLAACKGAVRERNSSQICKCMVERLESSLRTHEEYQLAGEIVKAVVRSGQNRERMQASFNRISQDFHRAVSIERKAAVLRAVTTEGVSCGKANT